jgi:hypothetical protein
MAMVPEVAVAHDAAPLEAEALPVGHGEHTSFLLAAPPTARKVPAGHAWHTPAPSRCVPAGQ